MNSDGALDSNTMSGGWGSVVRDEQGEVVTAGAGREEFLQSAFHAEVLGCIASLNQVAQLGIARVIMETDASIVKAALMTEDYRLSALGGLITKAKHVMMVDFEDCILSVCPESCIKVAHGLAALGCNLVSGSQTT